MSNLHILDPNCNCYQDPNLLKRVSGMQQRGLSGNTKTHSNTDTQMANLSTVSVVVHTINHSTSCMCVQYEKNRMWWLQYLPNNPLHCVIRPYEHACTHTHTRTAHSSQKKATGSLIYLSADSSALITVVVWHEAASCVSVSECGPWHLLLTVFMLVSVVDCRPWHFWFECWQLALFLGNEQITSILVHSVLTIKCYKNPFTCLNSDSFTRN